MKVGYLIESLPVFHPIIVLTFHERNRNRNPLKWA